MVGVLALLLLVPNTAAKPDTADVNPQLATVVSLALRKAGPQPLPPQFPHLADQLSAEASYSAQRAQEAAQALLEAQKVSTPTPVVTTPQIAPSGSCAGWIAQAGIGDVSDALIVINRESGCNPNAVNSSSGACGIPQALPCSKLGTSDPVAQLIWMNAYVLGRYGSWAGAVAQENNYGWY